MASRGINVTYEAIRQWALKFGQGHANELRRRQPQCGDKWHLDEVVLTIKGRHHYLWRALDQDDHVLDILMQSRRNSQAAKRFFRKLLKGLRYAPRVLVTDKLKSYAAAKKRIMPGVEHRQHKGLNNRAELSHQPTRQREKQMRRFKLPGHACAFCRHTVRSTMSSGVSATACRRSGTKSRQFSLDSQSSSFRFNKLTVPVIAFASSPSSAPSVPQFQQPRG